MYFKALLANFLEIIKCDFYKLWAGADFIHVVLLLMEGPTPVSGVPFIELTACKYDLNPVLHFRGKEEHTIVYQVIGGTHKIHAEVEAKVPGCLLVVLDLSHLRLLSEKNPTVTPKLLCCLLARINELNFHFKRQEEHKEKKITIQPETLNQPHFINHWHLITGKTQCSYQV